MNNKQITLASIFVGLSLFSLLNTVVHAVPGQWSSSGSVIYYNDGNLGLGTSSPEVKLHINGGHLYMDNNDSTSRIRTDGNIIVQLDRDNDGNRNNMFVITDYDHTYTLTAKGNKVGINTPNPTRDLSVNGTVLAKEVIVSTNPSWWPDYVFADDYNLMPLSVVEEYIKSNKHLPNIPSAAELEESGISIGEMQKLHMEKIEELTLHLIEQDKRIKELENILIQSDK